MKPRRTHTTNWSGENGQGYTPGENGTLYQHTDKADRVTGILPQLLNAIDYMDVERLLKDPAWCLQEKFDGKRTLLQKKSETVTAINRKGLAIGLPSSIGVGAQKITSDFVIDGECVVTFSSHSIYSNWRARTIDRNPTNGAWCLSQGFSTGPMSRTLSL